MNVRRREKQKGKCGLEGIYDKKMKNVYLHV
jgi:hypothetical protein